MERTHHDDEHFMEEAHRIVEECFIEEAHMVQDNDYCFHVVDTANQFVECVFDESTRYEDSFYEKHAYVEIFGVPPKGDLTKVVEEPPNKGECVVDFSLAKADRYGKNETFADLNVILDGRFYEVFLNGKVKVDEAIWNIGSNFIDEFEVKRNSFMIDIFGLDKFSKERNMWMIKENSKDFFIVDNVKFGAYLEHKEFVNNHFVAVENMFRSNFEIAYVIGLWLGILCLKICVSICEIELLKRVVDQCDQHVDIVWVNLCDPKFEDFSWNNFCKLNVIHGFCDEGAMFTPKVPFFVMFWLQEATEMKECLFEEWNETSYRSIVGSLLFLTHTRPDISYSVSLVSRYMKNPSEIHMKVAKRILRYVKGTINFGIHYYPSDKFSLIGFTDSDWGGCLDDRKSTSGHCFSFGSGLITWCSNKQSIVALSSTEAEYVAVTLAGTQALWLRKVLEEIGEKNFSLQ